jgi:hemolysin activation/secretion protein
MSLRRAWRAGLAGLTGVGALMVAGGPAQAAPVAIPRPGIGLSQPQLNPGQQLENARRQRAADVFSEPAHEVCQLSDDPSLAFDFRQGIIEDPAKILSEHDKEAAWANAIGRRITPHALCEIRDRLADRIFHRGVLARVIIPPQTISGGVVKFRVIAAKIISVRFDGDDIGPAQAKAEAYLNHLRERGRFDLDSAQRWLLLVNDIPGVQASAKIVHSTTPGAPPEGLDLLVTIKRTPVDEFGLISNYNSNILGPWDGIARVDLNGLTSWGEKTSLIAYTTLGNTTQQVAQIIESAKLGDTGLFGQANFAWSHSRPGGVLKPLDLTGNSYIGTIEVDYPFVRLQRENLTFAAGMDFVNQTTAFNTGVPLSNDALRVVWVRADMSAAASDRPVVDNMVSTAADLSVVTRKGIDALGASKAGAQGLSRNEGQPDAWVVNAEGHASLRITPNDPKYLPLTFSVHFIGQWANAPLLAYEEQPIGNLTIGRGYDPNAASGDEVAAGEFLFELGPLPFERIIRVTPYAFYDIAYVGYLQQGEQDVTLRSLGCGLEVRLPYDKRGHTVRLDLGYAKPLDKPIPSAMQKPPARYLLQVVIAH